MAIFVSLYLEIVKTAALKSEAGHCARRPRDNGENSASAEADREAQLKKSVETATAELQQERQKNTALTNELAAARGDFETKLALAGTDAAGRSSSKSQWKLRPLNCRKSARRTLR